MKLIIEDDQISKTWIAYIDGYREVIGEGQTVQEAINNLHRDIKLCGWVVENFAHEPSKEHHKYPG